MKSRYYIREHSPIARIAAWKLDYQKVALVVGHTIHLHNTTKAEFQAHTSWLCHELKHIEQYERLGVPGFLVRYLWASMKYGYWNNPFEVEARAAEKDFSLLDQFECTPH